MLTDEINPNTSPSIESACLPIGCSVSAKYRGAFCSAQVKTVERQVKLKVTLVDTGETIIISEEQILTPVSLRIGNKVFIRSLSSSSTTTTTNSHHSRTTSSTAIINSLDNYDKKQATIKQIYDNSIYTVVFNDGDEKSLRRSSLCLQGIRLYQTQIGQEKFLEDIPTSSTLPKDRDDLTSIVAIQRHGNNNNNKNVFPALILKRKSLADYIWVKSFLDGREYIVHKHDDVKSYKNNSDIQTLCRLTSKQATRACEKFIKYNQIPIIWQKKKKKQINNEQNSTNDSNTSDSDVDDSDDETTEEKDSFVAQLFAFMDDRGTPINNIPKIHNYDLDLHRLFKIVRTLGGYNKVTKNDQWNKVYIKMGLPVESSPKNGRSIEHAYKKYLFAYEDLSKKLGTMNAPNAYFGGRTSMSCDSRRSLVRVRQQSEEKKSTSIKQQSRTRLSIDSKQTLSSTKNQSNISSRKTRILKPSLSMSELEIASNEIILNNNNKIKKQQIINSKKIISTTKKPPIISDEKKKIIETKNSSLIDSRSRSAPVKKSKSTTDTENTMKPVIKIPKISYEILMESTRAIQKHYKKQTTKTQDNTSANQSNTVTCNQEESNAYPPLLESIKQTLLHDLTPLQVTPVSPSPPPSITDELPSFSGNTDSASLEAPSIFQSIMPSSIDNQQRNEIENPSLNTNKRSYENSESNSKIDEQLSPSKRSRHSLSSQDSNEKPDNHNIRLTYEDIFLNDILLVKLNLNQKNQYSAKCIEKNHKKKELLVHYKGLDSKYDEWIELDRVLQRQDEIDSNEEKNKMITNDQDTGIWKSLLNDDAYSSINSHQCSIHIFPNNSTNNNKNLISRNIDHEFEPTINNKSTQNINVQDNLSTSDGCLDPLPIKEEILDSSSITSQSTSILIEPIVPCLLNPNSPPENRRTSIRQQKRRTFRDPKDLSISTKKRTRLDIDLNSNLNIDSINNSDISSISIEQQSVEIKRCRTVGKRNVKRTVNQQDNENEDFHLNSPMNIAVRQQLEDMFKHRTSRYNFLDLNNNLTGDNRLTHLKDRMRQCQKVFFHLKSALTKIEKQRKIFLRRPKPSIAQPTTNDLLLPSTCT